MPIREAPWRASDTLDVLYNEKYLTGCEQERTIVFVRSMDHVEPWVGGPWTLGRGCTGARRPAAALRLRLTILSFPKYFTRMALPPVDPRPVPPAEPLRIHDHAMDNIRFIRTAMENAGSFTAVSGWGQVGIGITALAAALVASRQSTADGWLGVWLVEAAVAVVIGVAGISHKARATGVSLNSGPSRKLAVCFAPPLLAGAILTPVLHRAGVSTLLPGTWLMLFGSAVITGGFLSVAVVRTMGVWFMALGALALLGPSRWGDGLMAAGFGVVLIAYGLVIARRYGG